MNNDVFQKKLMDVPFIVDVKMLRATPSLKIPKELYENDKIGYMSPVGLKDGKWVITPEWRNGHFGMDSHLMDIVNPDTGGLFRIRILLEDESITFVEDNDYESQLHEYFRTIIKFSIFDQMSSTLLGDIVRTRLFGYGKTIKVFNNQITGTIFVCNDPYDLEITEDGDIIFGDRPRNHQVPDYAKAYKAYWDNVIKKEAREYSFKDAISKIFEKSMFATETESTSTVIYVVTNNTPSGEYTPSVFKELEDAQKWMIQTAINNFVAGNHIALGKGYENFFKDESDPYNKLMVTGGQGAVDVFIESYLDDADGNFVGEYRADIYYPDDTYNKFEIYQISIDNGIPTIKQACKCF